jgi:hypothetical protein
MCRFRSRCLSTRHTMLQGLLAELIPLPTDPDRMVAQLGAEDFLQKQNRLERLHIDMIEQPVKTPPDTLASHAEALVNLLSVGPLEDHVAGLSRFQLDPEVLRLHQGFQVLQKCLVFLGQLHVASP